MSEREEVARNDTESEIVEDDENYVDLFAEVQNIRIDHQKQIIISHLNVNSMGKKFSEIKEMQNTCKIDVLVLSETKLDGSYRQNTLEIEGYCITRQDKRSNSGGLMAYISKDIPHSQGSFSMCNDEMEYMSLELHISDDPIMLLCMYKNPRTDPVIFKRYFEEVFEQMSEKFDNIIVIGDLNFNMFNDNMLSAMMPSLNLTNVIKDATCFKSSQPTLIDVMLVTKRRKLMKSFSVNTGISDFHNLIGGVLRMHKPAPKTKKLYIRQLSKINYEQVLSDMSIQELSNLIELSPSANTACDALQSHLIRLLDKYAPKKLKIIKKTDFHCMSKELKRAIMHRNKLRNRYYKYRTVESLDSYRTQRNRVTEIKRKAINKYFEEKCKSGTKNKDFWRAVKPLFSKSRTKADSIPLRENGEIITDDKVVSNIFNTFFQNIGSDIGVPENNDKPLSEIFSQYKHHPSVKMIADEIIRGPGRKFTFRFVTEKETALTIKSLSSKKAAGYDELPTSFIKRISTKLVKPLNLLINRCILEKLFPKKLKKANITPLYKKKDKLNKDNFRSVNLLPVISKIMERLMHNQIYEHMADLFHNYLSGFRRGHSCQDVLIRMTEDWRESLDNGLAVGVIAIDLSKAFDCMPHGLLLAKLNAYGFDKDSCELMKSYITHREQRVKIGETYSSWVRNIKGVPQGSILGPLLFNIFINDFLYFSFNSKIYNYADDNTLCCTDINEIELNNKLKTDCLTAMKWFENNNMKANANKFQLMFLNRNSTMNSIIEVGDSKIKSTSSINILGVELDNSLKLDKHINEICSKVGKQINALKRIKHNLDKECKKIIYNSYINSNLGYCSVIWAFANATNMGKLENTNKRALRFVTNSNLSYEEICAQGRELKIKNRCMKSVAITMYKIKNGMAPQYITELFTAQGSHYEMRDTDKLRLPAFKTVSYGKNSLRYFGANLWNTIPVEIKTHSSLNTFKSAITRWLLNSYQ